MRHAFALALLLPAPAFAANPFMTDASDLWWNPAESGWGVNIIEQSNILFATFFVYSPDGRAHWYVASDMVCPGTFHLTEIEVDKQGFLGRISQAPAGSTRSLYGNMGGTRATVDQAPD